MTRTFASLLAVAVAVCAGSSGARAENIQVQPKGVYAEIDTRLSMQTLDILMKGSPAERTQAVARVKASPDKYSPPILYFVGHILFQNGEKDDGMFWFYAGQLRGRFDANRCTDVSARQAIPTLNQKLGGPINQYALQNLAKLEALIPRVIAWDRRTPYNYDHRWINLHGMAAMSASMGKAPEGTPGPLSAPKEEWAAIAEKTRAEYQESFRKAIENAKNRPPTK